MTHVSLKHLILGWWIPFKPCPGCELDAYSPSHVVNYGKFIGFWPIPNMGFSENDGRTRKSHRRSRSLLTWPSIPHFQTNQPGHLSIQVHLKMGTWKWSFNIIEWATGSSQYRIVFCILSMWWDDDWSLWSLAEKRDDMKSCLQSTGNLSSTYLAKGPGCKQMRLMELNGIRIPIVLSFETEVECEKHHLFSSPPSDRHSCWPRPNIHPPLHGQSQQSDLQRSWPGSRCKRIWVMIKINSNWCYMMLQNHEGKSSTWTD